MVKLMQETWCTNDGFYKHKLSLKDQLAELGLENQGAKDETLAAHKLWLYIDRQNVRIPTHGTESIDAKRIFQH